MSPIAPWFLPGQRFPLIICPHSPLTRVMLYPTFPHTLQRVTGDGCFAIVVRFYAFEASDSTSADSMAGNTLALLLGPYCSLDQFWFLLDLFL